VRAAIALQYLAAFILFYGSCPHSCNKIKQNISFIANETIPLVTGTENTILNDSGILDGCESVSLVCKDTATGNITSSLEQLEISYALHHLKAV